MSKEFEHLYRLSIFGEVLAVLGRSGGLVMEQTTKALVVGQAILAGLALVLACAPATADEREGNDRGERERDAIVNGTRLYEVTETVHFGADGLRVTRDAVAVLMGFAPLGTPLCPMTALITNPVARTCTVTGTGQDSVSVAGASVDGKGPVSGTFAVVVNAPGNSSVHVPACHRLVFMGYRWAAFAARSRLRAIRKKYPSPAPSVCRSPWISKEGPRSPTTRVKTPSISATTGD